MARPHAPILFLLCFYFGIFGAGSALAPRLMAAMGSQRERYQTAQEIHCYSVIAPVVASSGRQRWVHWRWACPKFLRRTFHEWALHSLAYSP